MTNPINTNNSANAKFDLAIVGGGMSGVTAAICYAQLGLSVALIEAVEPELDTSPSFDQRAIALSAASVAIYQSLGLWAAIQPLACPIETIHVSDRGHYGFTRLKASDHQVEALGQVIPLDLAGPVLWRQASQQKSITTFCPAKVVETTQSDDYCLLELDILEQESAIKRRIRASLVLAADGTFSQIAAKNEIQIKRHSYDQHAVIANIETQKPHLNRAFERFTASGPLALLPLTHNRMSLVWCQKPDQIDGVMAYDDSEFCDALQQAFGYRLGKIERVSKRFQYPLSLHLAESHYHGRTLLLGNAAHTLHPIAGQGFNLGLRDIAALNDLLIGALESQTDIGASALLQNFVDSRQSDWRQTILATDTLTRIFSSNFLPWITARTKSMNLVNLLPIAKYQLASAAMGYNLRSSRLARGIQNAPLKQQVG